MKQTQRHTLDRGQQLISTEHKNDERAKWKRMRPIKLAKVLLLLMFSKLCWWWWLQQPQPSQQPYNCKLNNKSNYKYQKDKGKGKGKEKETNNNNKSRQASKQAKAQRPVNAHNTAQRVKLSTKSETISQAFSVSRVETETNLQPKKKFCQRLLLLFNCLLSGSASTHTFHTSKEESAMSANKKHTFQWNAGGENKKKLTH